jgi:hypothetical protein
MNTAMPTADDLGGLVKEQVQRCSKPGHRTRPSHNDLAETTDFRTVSLRVPAELLDTIRSSARPWLREAGIRPVANGRGRNGAIRDRRSEAHAWLGSRRPVGRCLSLRRFVIGCGWCKNSCKKVIGIERPQEPCPDV